MTDGARNDRHAVAILITGLSGAGKTTLATAVSEALATDSGPPILLDGDALRVGLCRDLGFSHEHREEHMRRAAEMARLLCDAGLTVILSLIAPYRTARENARRIIGSHRFVEVHLDIRLETCETRDPKGLYRRARAGTIQDLPGVHVPYERSLYPTLTLTEDLSVAESVSKVVARVTGTPAQAVAVTAVAADGEMGG
jgi:adenylylsulfate kinase